MADEAIHSLLETLSRLLEQFHHPDINREIVSINDESYALRDRLKNNSEDLEEQIKEAAATTKEMIRYFLSGDNPLYGGLTKPTEENLQQLKDVAEYMKSTVQNLKSTPGDAAEEWVKAFLKDICASTTATRSKDVIIGVDEDLTKIRYRMTNSYQGSHQLQVLSIVGTGGIGKTTLAKLAYNDESIVRHFDIRAWVTVSQDYTVANIVSNLLASLEEGGFPVERDGQGEISMESLIKKHLNRGRFLIVIDDVWTKKAWDYLKTLFPDTGSSSRIMLTTRIHEVADYVNSPIPIHFMRLLNAGRSWNLLKKKVFLDESCPIQLEDIGRKIVKICGGLPLSIVMVAGILSNLPKTRYSWKKYAADHGTLETGTLETIITLSYKYLPDYMRDCFLYMGGFPEDYEIRVSELIKLWIGEGFLKIPIRSISLEEEAAKVLDNLVERNIVMVSRRKFDGKIKSCILHDIVRDFCIWEAQRDKFFLSVMDYLPTPILRRHFLPRLLKTYGRISVGSQDLDLKNSTDSSSTHSIICIPQGGYKCASSMNKFSSLRVFHVLRRNNNWEWKPNQVLDLMRLTYLASNIPTNIVPSNILKFENLQTLNIYRSEVVLPAEIWMLRQLRHLMAFSFHSPPQPNKETLPLEKLQVMSLMIDLICSERMIEIIPNIKKLGICHSSSTDCKICNLSNLKQLEKLKLVSLERLPIALIFPLSLKKLTLCGLMLPWEDLGIIGALPSLQMLKLRNCACRGTIWQTAEGEFKQLECLLVEESNLYGWWTESSHFPKLKSLVFHYCPHLRGIPKDIGCISTLELITVDAGNKSLVDSAKMIQKDQERKGNYKIRVCDSKPFRKRVCYSNDFFTQQRESIAAANYLPYHLNECFLYMAAFPEDYVIRASEIIILWVAEGFVKSQTETRSLEEEAEDYLNDLVLRRLVLVTSWKTDGKIKTFRLHERVRDFCIMDAVERKFILPIRDNIASTTARRDFQRISCSWCDLNDSMHSSSIQTFICIQMEEFGRECSVRDFTSLRVLHVLLSYCWYWRMVEVFDHIHLTYLASKFPSGIVPPAISKLQSLQTLIIYNCHVNLPAEIWRMSQLRHLTAFLFHPLPNPEDADLPLENLQTLSSVRDFVCSERMVAMIPNIKKLGLYYSGQYVGESNLSTWYHLDNLSQLLHLEKLKLEMPTSFLTSLPVFPPSLKKLNLSGGGLPWSDMTIIGSLPHLQVLKLRNYACHGEEWTTADGEFRQLRFLLIDKSNLRNWRAENVPFPRLRCLMLHHCRYLSEIPREIGDIATLELIEVGYNQSLLDSVRTMQKGSLKYGGIDKFEVRAKHFFDARELAEDSVFGSMSDRLKQCFLYMAAFPRDYEIRASEIVKLWVAEGFLGWPTETRSLEEEAKDCLDDLVQRGLIFVISRKVDGEIKSCRLDDMVRDFCVREAVEHKFILPLKDYFPSPIAMRDCQRVSASLLHLHYGKDAIRDRQRTQTVICISPEYGFRYECSLRDYTSLRVFHVLRSNNPSYPEVSDNIQLTYLASNVASSIVPPAISKLQSLQTLIIYRRGVYLPAEIWRMPKLRHLMALSFHPLPNPEDADVPLENLQTLSLVTDFVCSERMVVKIPNIKKLGLDYSGQNVEKLKLGLPRSFWTCIPFFPKSNLSSRYHLDNLAQLLHLEKLKLEMPTFKSFWVSLPVFPPSLKKLNLSGGGLPWRNMTIIGSLPNLQVLKLRNYACHGEEWKTNNGEFQQLRFLLIDGSDLRNWRAETVPFPRLRCLMLHRCRYLSEIPRQIADIATLELIELDYDNDPLWDSVYEMQEGSQENGIDKFEVRWKRFS